MGVRDDKPSKAEPANGRGAAEEKGNGPSVSQIRELYALMVAEGLSFLEVKNETSEFRLNRQNPVASHPAPAAPPSPPPGNLSSIAESEPPAPGDAVPSITAPLAGVFYRASSPSVASFVKEGDLVEPGQTLCIIEAMKVMNEIKAESRCRIVKIVAENARAVAAGQSLFLVEPA